MSMTNPRCTYCARVKQGLPVPPGSACSCWSASRKVAKRKAADNHGHGITADGFYRLPMTYKGVLSAYALLTKKEFAHISQVCWHLCDPESLFTPEAKKLLQAAGPVFKQGTHGPYPMKPWGTLDKYLSRRVEYEVVSGCQTLIKAELKRLSITPRYDSMK